MSLRLALVDDSEAFAGVAASLEREPGVEEVAVHTDPTAVPDRAVDYDCVLVANATSQFDGLTLLDAVRERSAVPVVLLVESDTADVTEALDRGADDVVLDAHETPPTLLANRVVTVVEARASTGGRGADGLTELAIPRLLEMTRDCMAADGPEEVHRIAVDMMENVFGIPSCSFRTYDPDREVLEMAVGGSPQEGLTDIPDRPDYDVHGSMPGKVLVESRPILSRVRRDGPDPFERGDNAYSLYIPAGDHGVFSLAVTDDHRTAFGPAEVRVVRAFAANATAALDRIAYERELEEKRRGLERQNERLEQFASFVSHDLRNPLSVLDGYLDLARRTGDEEYFDRCADAVDRMDDLIDDMLEYAREGARVESPERVELEPLVHEAWAGAETDAATLSVADDLGGVRGDPGRLRRLFENLFHNAVEHGGHDVSVTVGRFDEGFYVADDGPGVPPEDRDAVFDSGFTSDGDGTGFGLAIVSEIAAAHGWTVDVTDGAAGGARFEVGTREDGADRAATA